MKIFEVEFVYDNYDKREANGVGSRKNPFRVRMMYPRDREYCTYDPPSRRTPPPNSFTATYEDYKKYMFREDITEQVMQNFDAPVISYEWFVEDQDETMLRIQEHYGIKANFREENKKEIIENPDYSKIFTNYEEIELWFH